MSSAVFCISTFSQVPGSKLEERHDVWLSFAREFLCGVDNCGRFPVNDGKWCPCATLARLRMEILYRTTNGMDISLKKDGFRNGTKSFKPTRKYRYRNQGNENKEVGEKLNNLLPFYWTHRHHFHLERKSIHTKPLDIIDGVLRYSINLHGVFIFYLVDPSRFPNYVLQCHNIRLENPDNDLTIDQLKREVDNTHEYTTGSRSLSTWMTAP